MGIYILYKFPVDKILFPLPTCVEAVMQNHRMAALHALVSIIITNCPDILSTTRNSARLGFVYLQDVSITVQHSQGGQLIELNCESKEE